MEMVHIEHVTELLRYINLDKLLKHAPRNNFPPAIFLAILEEYRRRIASGKCTIKQEHFSALFEIAAIIYDHGNENDRRKMKIFFDELEALFYKEETKQENKINWDAIFKQCEEDSEKEYWEWLAENPDWLNKELEWELEREREQEEQKKHCST